MGGAVLVGMHCPPLEHDALRTTLIYSDAIQFVHDQTIRLMNQGVPTRNIIQTVKQIYPFKNEPYLREQYGTLEWSIKGIIGSYVGWFNGNPAYLTEYDRPQKMLHSLGGPSALLKRIHELNQSSDKDDLLHALELIEFLEEKPEIYFEILIKLAKVQS